MEKNKDWFKGQKLGDIKEKPLSQETGLKTALRRKNAAIEKSPPENRMIAAELSANFEESILTFLARTDNDPELLEALRELLHTLNIKANFGSFDWKEKLPSGTTQRLTEQILDARDIIREK